MNWPTTQLTFESMPEEGLEMNFGFSLIHLRFHFMLKWKFLFFENIPLTSLQGKGVLAAFNYSLPSPDG